MQFGDIFKSKKNKPKTKASYKAMRARVMAIFSLDRMLGTTIDSVKAIMETGLKSDDDEAKDTTILLLGRLALEGLLRAKGANSAFDAAGNEMALATDISLDTKNDEELVKHLLEFMGVAAMKLEVSNEAAEGLAEAETMLIMQKYYPPNEKEKNESKAEN